MASSPSSTRLLLLLAAALCGATAAEQRTLFNFTTLSSLAGWTESSDGTAREAGMSTGAFKLQRTALFQRAVLFSLLNPQPSGAGFVGYYQDGHWDLSAFQRLRLRARAQGQAFNYKVFLGHHGQSIQEGSYESYFEMPVDTWSDVSLPFDSFAFYYRGALVPDAPLLDPSDVTQLGLQVFGGVYSDFKQSGASALELDWITADQ